MTEQLRVLFSAPKKKRSIKDEVGNMINQLKFELESLLKFNENLLSFNSSIVKKAVKSKVETFFSTVSTAIDSQIEEVSSNDTVEAAANILDVTKDIGRSMASTLGKPCIFLFLSSKNYNFLNVLFCPLGNYH